MTRPSSRLWLLLTTLALGGVLVTTAVMNYLGSAEASEVMIRARGADLVHSARRAMRFAGSLGDDVLADFLSDAEERGLRFIGIVDSSGKLVSEAGTRLGSLEGLPVGCQCAGADIELEPVKGRLRLVATLIPIPGPRPHRHGAHPMGWRDFRLVVEFEPVDADRITGRAFALLAMSLAAAALLLVAAGVFWRMARQADEAALQLARDRELKALGEMSAVLGHELRNPLTSLKGHAQLLLERLPADHAGRAGAETVVREAQRLEALTGQVLDFARTDRLSVALENVRALLEAAVQSAPGPVRLEMCGELPAWPFDRTRMEQVLANLLQNALQASPEEGSVVLSARVDEQGLSLQVQDRGPGIEPGEEERIFEPFYTKRVKGTGLGLAVARRIVEGHQGKLTAANRPDGGAVFTVRLPPGPG